MLCGSQTPVTKLLASPVTLQFYSDSSLNTRGFLASYKIGELHQAKFTNNNCPQCNATHYNCSPPMVKIEEWSNVILHHRTASFFSEPTQQIILLIKRYDDSQLYGRKLHFNLQRQEYHRYFSCIMCK